MPIRKTAKGRPTVTRASSSMSPEANCASAYNAIESTYIFNECLKKKLAPRLQHQFNKARELSAKAKEKTKNLSALPKHLRSHPFLLKDPSQLRVLQHKAILEGLDKKFKHYKGLMKITFTPEEINSLGLKESRDKKQIQGKVNPAKLMDIIFAKTGGADLVRKQVVSNSVSPEQFLKKYGIPTSGNQTKHTNS